MIVIGITGGSGCGKTTALASVRALGGRVLDCDVVYHSLLETNQPMLQAISERFHGVVKEGILDRKSLGKQVFQTPSALQILNEITHPYVCQEVCRQLEDWRKENCLLAAIDAIGLFESGLAQLCDVTVAVIAPEEFRVRRLQMREGISEDYALARIRAQKSNREFVSQCDYVLDNDVQDIHSFADKCDKLFQTIIGGISHGGK